MMPKYPKPPPSSTTYSPRQMLLIDVYKSSCGGCIMSYDPVEGGLVPHHWHVTINFAICEGLTLHCFCRPVKADGQRIPPEKLLQYRKTHEYLGPGCLCPLLEPLTGYKEAAIYLTVDGLYKGEYVAECADDRCDYLSQSPFSHPRPTMKRVLTLHIAQYH